MENSRAGGKADVKRVNFSTRLNPELVKRLKYMAVDEGKKLNELLEEAIELLLDSHKKKKGSLFD
jgi:predicted DNA-binding protein